MKTICALLQVWVWLRFRGTGRPLSQSAKAVLPGWILYGALTLAVRADAVEKRAWSGEPASTHVREHGPAGLLQVGRNGIPRALPWAKVFRPVGALYLLLDKALKGRHIIAQGNALGPNRIKSSKP